MKLQLTYTFETEDELRAHLGAEPATPAAPEPARQPETHSPSVAQREDDDAPTVNDVDADGMPYDASVHSDPPQFTAKGIWRAQRGKADEAQAARNAWKAGGGNVTPAPAALPGGEPETTAPPALPGADTAPEPVTYDDFVAKAAEMLGDGSIDQERLAAIYTDATGVSGTRDEIVKGAGEVLFTNETARAKAYAALCAV